SSLLFVSQFSGERGAFVRHMDRTGELGPIVSLADEHVVGAIDAADGRWTLVTSDGTRACVATYQARSAEPEARGCAEIAADSVVAVGDRLAFIEAHVAKPPPPAAPPLNPKLPPHRAKTHRAKAAIPKHPPAHKTGSKHAKATGKSKPAP